MEDERMVRYPLYEIEFETSQIISPIVFTQKDWLNKKYRSPFYENINREGIELCTNPNVLIW